MSIVTMPLSIQIEFKSVDEAIVALGKLAGAPSVPSKEAAAAPQGAATDAPAARKGRSDKGQTRGKYAPRQSEANTGAGGAPAGQDALNAASQASSTEAPPASAPVEASPAATRAEAQAALEALVSGVNLDAGIKLLAEFGTQRLRDLPDEKLGEFVAKAKASLPKVAA